MRSHRETRRTALRSCGWQRCDPQPCLLSWSFLAAAAEVSWTSLQFPTNKPKWSQSLPSTSDWQIQLLVFIHYIRILSSVTMPTCDALLRHFRKMLLRMRIRGCTLSSTLGHIHLCHIMLHTVSPATCMHSYDCSLPAGIPSQSIATLSWSSYRAAAVVGAPEQGSLLVILYITSREAC